MEELSLPNALLTAVVTFLLLFLFPKLLSSLSNKSKGSTPPEVAGPWPIIGHLPRLSGGAHNQLPHKVLGSLADEYGPIFRLKLGMHKVIVISHSKLAKECFTANDKALASRPKSLASEIMGYNHAVLGFAPYGQFWRDVRNIVVREMLSNRQMRMLSDIRVSDVRSNLKDAYEHWLRLRNPSNWVDLEMKQWFGNLVGSSVVKMIAGKGFSMRDEEGSKSYNAIVRFVELLGTFVISDYVPFLRWLDIGGHTKVMRETANHIDSVLEGWLREHRSKRNSGGGNSEREDVMDMMLSFIDQMNGNDFRGHGADAVVKSTCLALLSGALDTTTVTLTWAVSLLLNNDHALKKAQDELDFHVGKGRLVEESDIKNLKYLQAIVKETLRLYPPLPLSVPHEAVEDCTVGGYFMPRGTRLFTNLWKIHRDPSVWEDPDEFRPERFLEKHKDVDPRGHHFGLIPFGSGRRICPGMSLGLHVVQFVLASLLHGFEMKRPSEELIDMTETSGLTNLKATPLQLLLAPRLSTHLYNIQ